MLSGGASFSRAAGLLCEISKGHLILVAEALHYLLLITAVIQTGHGGGVGVGV